MYYGVVPTVGRFDLLLKANEIRTKIMIGREHVYGGQRPSSIDLAALRVVRLTAQMLRCSAAAYSVVILHVCSSSVTLRRTAAATTSTSGMAPSGLSPSILLSYMFFTIRCN